MADETQKNHEEEDEQTVDTGMPQNINFHCLAESISPCSKHFTAESMLSHFLIQHTDQNLPQRIQCSETFKGDMQVLALDPTKIKLGETQVLGVLAYGGVKDQCVTLPACCGICSPNIDLPENFEHFAFHLPILIMGGRTLRNPSSLKDHVYVFWLSAPGMTGRVVFSLKLTSADNWIGTQTVNCAVRDLHKAQDPFGVYADYEGYLSLNRNGMAALSFDFRQFVCLEASINETPNNAPSS